MKKTLIGLLSLCLVSSFLFGIEAGNGEKTSHAVAGNKLAIFGDLGFAVKIDRFGLRKFFIQAGAQYGINDTIFAEILLNRYFSSSATHSISNSTSFGIGLAGVYKIKLDQGFLIALKIGLLIHMNPSMKSYAGSYTLYTHARTDFGIQFGPGIEYMLAPDLGFRAGAAFNILLANNTPLWFGLTGGVIYKF
jgi:hypothetical protein